MAEVYLTVEGQIRGVRELRRKDDQSVIFGRAVSILTGSGARLGDTTEVTVFTGDHPDAAGLKSQVGQTIAWTVAASGNKYGLKLTYRDEVLPSTFHAIHDTQSLEDMTSSQADAVAMHADF